jgi:aryl-alcohol dehydrogenase-like predicted oxidoreductase
MKRVILGRSQIETSVLAVGTGTNGSAHASDQTRRGTAWLAGTLRSAVELGVTFWDLADEYGSHASAAEALRTVERSRVCILTKTFARSGPACTRDVDRFLGEIGTDYLDVVLLHCLTDARWPRRLAGAMEALARAREAGKVRAVGFSAHSLAALRTGASEPWVQVMLARFNSSGRHLDGGPGVVAPVLRVVRDAGIGVVAMKVLGCGDLAHDVSGAVRFVAEADVAHAITVGPTQDGHLDEVAAAVERHWR